MARSDGQHDRSLIAKASGTVPGAATSENVSQALTYGPGAIGVGTIDDIARPSYRARPAYLSALGPLVDSFIPIPREFGAMTRFPVEHAVVAGYDLSLNWLAGRTLGVGNGTSVEWSDDALIDWLRANPRIAYATFAHNHPEVPAGRISARQIGAPSQDHILPLTVSQDDIQSTAGLLHVTAQYGVRLRDHVVVGQTRACSIRKMAQTAGNSWPNAAPGMPS